MVCMTPVLWCVARILVASLASSSGMPLSASPRETPMPAVLDIVAGDEQEGVVGTELPEALTVRVLDANQRPISGQLVVFRVTEGGGSVFAGAAITDPSGIARERWTLGTSTSGNQRVEARAVDSKTGHAMSSRLGAVAKPGAAASLERTTPHRRSGGRHRSDAAARRAGARLLRESRPGVSVTFAPARGAPSPEATPRRARLASRRSADGPRYSARTNTLVATAAGLTPVTFPRTAASGGNAVTKRRTDPQVAQVATSVAAPPSARSGSARKIPWPASR